MVRRTHKWELLWKTHKWKKYVKMTVMMTVTHKWEWFWKPTTTNEKAANEKTQMKKHEKHIKENNRRKWKKNLSGSQGFACLISGMYVWVWVCMFVIDQLTKSLLKYQKVPDLEIPPEYIFDFFFICGFSIIILICGFFSPLGSLWVHPHLSTPVTSREIKGAAGGG